MHLPNMGEKKSISRSVGEFFGHIFKGVRTKVDDAGREVERTEVSRTVEEEQRGENIVLRRTTIDEIELRQDGR
jgi:hypothetical protein